EIDELKKKFAEIRLRMMSVRIRMLGSLILEGNKRHDVENVKLKVRIKRLEKNKTDSLAENVGCNDEIAELKAELVKLRDGDEESK
ncbi:6060_t:CDS:2, partial [Racocetra persica]